MSDRQFWLDTAITMGKPMFDAVGARELKKRFPAHRRPLQEKHSYLEVTGRYLSGISPWFDLPREQSAEGLVREEYAEKARDVLDAISDPQSPDFVQWEETSGYGSRQPVVDASYVALALVRSPRELIDRLDPRVKRNLIERFCTAKKILPSQNNWLLFSAMLDVALYLLEAEWDKICVDYAIRKHMDWYIGDGLYCDGDDFKCDYYNSFVIHPYLVDIICSVGDLETHWADLKEPILNRARRYAEILERSVSPEGTFPLVGRSLTYRFAAFQSLSQIALKQELPHYLPAAQVRCALSAVIKRIMEAPNNYDENGWLQTGFCGPQPSLAEPYMSQGSQYLCANIFLALGLSENSSFWCDAPLPWTSKRIYGGEDCLCEYALEKRLPGYPEESCW